MLWNWRQQIRRGVLAPELMPMFVPVQIMPDLPLLLPSPSFAQVTSPAEDVRVEITLPDGTCVQVGTGGRDTAAKGVSDVDVAFRLLYEVWEKYNVYQTDGQSVLL